MSSGCQDPIFHIPRLSTRGDFSSMALITCMNGQAFFLKIENCSSDFFPPCHPLSAISKQSMTNCLFNAFSRISVKVRNTARYPPQLPPRLPLRSCSEVGTNNKDNVRWVMISHFLPTCTPLLIRSVWQWKLIFFSLSGDITMIYFGMEWRKLEDCCNMRSEINLLWCEKSRGMWGINKYEITLSVFSSNRKRASFGEALLCQKCDPLWPSLGWKGLGNEILSIYRPLIQYHTHRLCHWLQESQLRGKERQKSNSVSFWFYTVDSKYLLAINKLCSVVIHLLLAYVSSSQLPGVTANWKSKDSQHYIHV